MVRVDANVDMTIFLSGKQDIVFSEVLDYVLKHVSPYSRLPYHYMSVYPSGVISLMYRVPCNTESRFCDVVGIVKEIERFIEIIGDFSESHMTVDISIRYESPDDPELFTFCDDSYDIIIPSCEMTSVKYTFMSGDNQITVDCGSRSVTFLFNLRGEQDGDTLGFDLRELYNNATYIANSQLNCTWQPWI